MKLNEFIQIIERLQRKDKSALSRLYEEYFDKIYALAFSEVRNRQEAYDIAMGVIMKLCDYRGAPDEITNHIGLMIRMTRNTVKDYYRKRSFYSNFDYETAVSETSDNFWLDDILSVLTEEEREIFCSHVIWDKKLSEIAAETGKPYISIRRIYSRIRGKIQNIYK